MKSATIFWQSQSGNTFACVKTAEEELERNGVKVKLHHILSKNPPDISSEVLIFAFPIYNFKPATTMRDFIKNLPEGVKDKRALIIVNCSGLWTNTPAIMKKLLKTKGITLCGALKTKGSESYILLRKYVKLLNNNGQPDTKQLQKVRNFVKKAFEKELKPKFFFFNPLSLFHWLGAISPDNAPGMAYPNRTIDMNKCTLCGFCYKLCPSGAITREDDSLKCDEKKCLGCCGCFNVCPVSAWETPTYKNENFYKGEWVKEFIKQALNSKS